MNDTPREIESHFARLMSRRTGSERVEMLFSMAATAKAITASSIRAERPTISEADLRAAVFERLYASDYSPEELSAIRERIRMGR